MTGRGISVAPPIDRPIVINNVIKHFSGKELDRSRATEILDYIIQKKKKVEVDNVKASE